MNPKIYEELIYDSAYDIRFFVPEIIFVPSNPSDTKGRYSMSMDTSYLSKELC